MINFELEQDSKTLTILKKKQKYSCKCYKRSEEMKAHSTKRCRLSLKLVLNVSDHPIGPPDEGETFLEIQH